MKPFNYDLEPNIMIFLLPVPPFYCDKSFLIVVFNRIILTRESFYTYELLGTTADGLFFIGGPDKHGVTSA